MLKKTIFLLPCLFLLLLGIYSFSEKRPSAVKTIIIDPGHGGIDQGADGMISTEAQVTLAVSQRLGEKLAAELPDIKVLFTRTTDIIPGNSRNKTEGLRYRANFANSSKADLFISIHCNSAGRSPGGWNERQIVDYTEKETYVGKGKKRRLVTTKVPVYENVFVPNAAKGTETFIWTAKENSHKEQLVGSNAEFSEFEQDSSLAQQDNDPMMNALKLVYTKKYFMKSLKLAELVQSEFEKRGRVNRGVKQRNDVGIWVLHATGMPSILVETGFISNKEEEEYMNSEAGREEIVTDILNAIKTYVSSVDTQKNKTENDTVPAEIKSVAAVLPERKLKSKAA